MRGAALRADRARDQAVAVAWIGAALGRAAKMPPLQTLMSGAGATGGKARVTPQSPVEQQAMFDILAVRWGATLKQKED